MMDIDRIRDELTKYTGDDAMEMLGDYATERIMKGAKLPKGKTLKGAFDALYNYASKHKKGNHAFIPPAKAFEIVDGYFGWGSQEEPAKTVEVAAMPTDTLDDLDLDAMLWG